MFTDFRERRKEGERQRKIHVREKHQSVASCMHPNLGLNPQPRRVPCLGIEPVTFQCTGRCSNQLSHRARAKLCDVSGEFTEASLHSRAHITNSPATSLWASDAL